MKVQNVCTFLKGEIGFGRIMDVIRNTLDGLETTGVDTLEEVLEADTRARARARDMLHSAGAGS